MTKVYIDCDDYKLEEKLNEAYNHLNAASNVNCAIPNDFYYRSLLGKHLNQIKQSKQKVANIKQWYQDSKKDFKFADDEAAHAISKINDIVIQKNNRLIK